MVIFQCENLLPSFLQRTGLWLKKGNGNKRHKTTIKLKVPTNSWISQTLYAQFQNPVGGKFDVDVGNVKLHILGRYSKRGKNVRLDKF